MNAASNLLKIVKEGQAQIQIPETVFYNPVQEFNRDLSVLVLRTFLKHNVWHHKKEERHVLGRGGMKVLDALSASGLRSIRYAKELGPCAKVVKTIVANDLSSAAVNLIKRNVEANGVQDKVECSHSDAIDLLHSSSRTFDDRFHVIDLDPFGSGAKFFDAAVRSIGEAGLLMVTCTDTAVLCGNAGDTCFARYGSMSLRADFCHEAALRIILRSLEQHAGVYGRHIKPLLSVSVDFYVRLFLQVFTSRAETQKSASKLSQVFLCRECKTPELNTLGTCEIKDPSQQGPTNLKKFLYKPSKLLVGNKCEICGGSYSLGGPIWSHPMHDTSFLSLLKQELDVPEIENDFVTFRRLQGVVHMCCEELDVPLFHSIDNITSVLRIKMPRASEIMSALANEGYKVSLTHTRQGGLKTNAPKSTVWDIFCQIADQRGQKTSDPLATRIMARPRSTYYSFEYNPAIEAESQKRSLLRFQTNPTRDWGPKPRPRSCFPDTGIKLDHSPTKLTSDTNGETGGAKKRKASESLDKT